MSCPARVAGSPVGKMWWRLVPGVTSKKGHGLCGRWGCLCNVRHGDRPPKNCAILVENFRRTICMRPGSIFYTGTRNWKNRFQPAFVGRDEAAPVGRGHLINRGAALPPFRATPRSILPERKCYGSGVISGRAAGAAEDTKFGAMRMIEAHRFFSLFQSSAKFKFSIVGQKGAGKDRWLFCAFAFDHHAGR